MKKVPRCDKCRLEMEEHLKYDEFRAGQWSEVTIYRCPVCDLRKVARRALEKAA